MHPLAHFKVYAPYVSNLTRVDDSVLKHLVVDAGDPRGERETATSRTGAAWSAARAPQSRPSGRSGRAGYLSSRSSISA